MGESNVTPEVVLDFEYFPRGEESALRLLASRPEIGLAFKFHCFEAGPFHQGIAEKRDDGAVVFVYESGPLKCVTTFTAVTNGRVAMDLEVTGPLEELKKIRFIDGCLQHWQSPAFGRRGALAEFTERAFIYTMRGPVGLLDTPRGKQEGFPVDSPWNNPACTQWYGSRSRHQETFSGSDLRRRTHRRWTSAGRCRLGLPAVKGGNGRTGVLSPSREQAVPCGPNRPAMRWSCV
jgi:hypothetical protein